jgi:Ca2+-dependent lipid-binding protein
MEVRLRVVEARDLPTMDRFGIADPYCIIYIRGQTKLEHTSTQRNTATPTWDESFTFNVLSYATDILTIKMMDKDLAKRDDKMGKLHLALVKIPPGRVVERWYNLLPRKKCPKPGQIHLVIQVVLKGTPVGDATPFPVLVIRVTVVEARDLAVMDVGGKSDPFVVLRLAQTTLTFTTSVKSHTLSPSWNETAELLITNPGFDVIEVQVRDKDMARSEPMADLLVPIARFTDMKPNDSWYELTPAKGVNRGGKIRLVFQLATAPTQEYDSAEPGSIGKIPKSGK